MKNKNLAALVLSSVILALVLMMASGCATNRKCNGKKGIRTPMGLM